MLLGKLLSLLCCHSAAVLQEPQCNEHWCINSALHHDGWRPAFARHLLFLVGLRSVSVTWASSWALALVVSASCLLL